MSIHYGVLSPAQDLESVNANKKDIASLKTTVSSHRNFIDGSAVEVGRLQRKVGDLETSNAKKLEYSATHSFVYTNSANGAWSSPTGKTQHGPWNIYVPLREPTYKTYIHLQQHEFDGDTSLSGSETAKYKIVFVYADGTKASWTSPSQTISNERIADGVYMLDVKLLVTTVLDTNAKMSNCRALTIEYQPTSPGKVSGNESRLTFLVYSTVK